MKRFAILMTLVAALLSSEPADAKPWGEQEHLIVPRDYTPAKAWPLIVVSQNQVAESEMAKVPYFAIYCQPGDARSIIPLIARKYHLDPFRIYGTGFSRSGHGLLEDAWTVPDTFAAIAPVCEDMRYKEQYKRQKIDLLKYIRTPTYLWHGEHDSFRKTGRKNFEIMQAAGCPVQWGSFPGGHNPDGIYFKDIRKLTDFFDKHKLNPWPRQVTHVVYRYDATRVFWVDARVGAGSIEKEFPVFSVAVSAPNRIEVTANDGVKQLTFYLAPQLVDMSKPLVVTFAGREIYHGKATDKLTVKLADGELDARPAGRPLWEQLQAIRTQPTEAGALDWLFLDMHTSFADARLGRPVRRRVSLEIGLRPSDAPKAAPITPASRTFQSLDLFDPKAALNVDLSKLARKLPVQAAAQVKRFALAGGTDGGPLKLRPAGPGDAVQALVVIARLSNRGRQDLVGVARLNRSPVMRYPIGMWPKAGSTPDLNFVRGIHEFAGTRGLSWQYAQHGNLPYQVLGFLMLDPDGSAKISAMEVSKTSYRNSFYGVQREIALAGGESADIPLLLISLDSPNPTAAQPTVPDLAGTLGRLKTDLLGAARR